MAFEEETPAVSESADEDEIARPIPDRGAVEKQRLVATNFKRRHLQFTQEFLSWVLSANFCD